MICSMNEYFHWKSGKDASGRYTKLTSHLVLGEAQIGSEPSSCKKPMLSNETPGYKFCYTGGGGRACKVGVNFLLRNPICKTGKRGVALAQAGEQRLGTEGPWIPYEPAPNPRPWVVLRNRQSLRAMVIVLNFSYLLSDMGQKARQLLSEARI